jgi:hypothetical protein
MSKPQWSDGYDQDAFRPQRTTPSTYFQNQINTSLKSLLRGSFSHTQTNHGSSDPSLLGVHCLDAGVRCMGGCCRSLETRSRKLLSTASAIAAASLGLFVTDPLQES